MKVRSGAIVRGLVLGKTQSGFAVSDIRRHGLIVGALAVAKSATDRSAKAKKLVRDLCVALGAKVLKSLALCSPSRGTIPIRNLAQ